jgi:Glyoxalase-like domain
VVHLSNRLLGDGHGLDHLVIAVSDLQQASSDFGRLGFDVRPGGRHPGGTENTTLRLANETYLELLGVHDPTTKHGKEVLEWLKKGDGGLGFALETSSIDGAVDFLRDKGLETRGPTAGTITFEKIPETPPSLWRTLKIITPVPYLSDVVFLIEYNLAARADFLSRYPELAARRAPAKHPNGAHRLASVWIGVDDLEKAAHSWKSIDLSVGPVVRLPRIQAVGRKVSAGSGSILLVRSETKDGPVSRLLSRRGAAEGIMGVSLEARNSATAIEVLSSAGVSYEASPLDGHGSGLLVPPESARGIWVELLES